jgi:DnaK suppressor protein
MTSKASLSHKQLKQYKDLLVSTRVKITKDIQHIESQNLNSHKESSGDLSGYSLHMADVGTDNYDREFALDIVGNEQNILYEIDQALARLERGNYGICEMLSVPIPSVRLDAIPWTPYCKEAAEKIERERGRV